MRKRILVFLLAALFMFSAGIASAKMLEHRKPKLPSKEERQDRIKARVTALSIKLNLSEEQQKKITALLSASKEEINKILEDIGDKVQELRTQSEIDLRSVLNEEQKHKYDAVVEVEEDDDDIVKIIK